jgi:hypothetical protein
VLGTLGLRLAIELRCSKLSFGALLLAGALYLCSAALELEMLSAPASMIEGVIESTVTMLGHLSLLAAVACYARHVYLDATGRLKVHIDPDRKGKARRTKLKVVKAEKSEKSETSKPRPAVAVQTTKANDAAKFGAPASGAAKPVAAISKAALAPPDDEDDEEDDEYAGDSRSKSERRRLKKLARRDQQRRAA